MLSSGKVNTDQFNMVAGSITLSALMLSHSCSFFLFFFPLSFHSVAYLFFSTCPPSILSSSITHSRCSVTMCPKPFCLLYSTNDFKLLPHLTSSFSLCLSLPVMLPSSKPPRMAFFLFSLFTRPSKAPAILLADN